MPAGPIGLLPPMPSMGGLDTLSNGGPPGFNTRGEDCGVKEAADSPSAVPRPHSPVTGPPQQDCGRSEPASFMPQRGLGAEAYAGLAGGGGGKDADRYDVCRSPMWNYLELSRHACLPASL